MTAPNDKPANRPANQQDDLPTAETLSVYRSNPARAQGGDFAKSWWAGRWLRALTRMIDATRLARGRSCARAGHTEDLQIQVGLVTASIQDSRPQLYQVRLEVKTLSEAEWERAIAAMASQAIYAAQLLNGEMPQGIEESFNSVGISLFPTSLGELRTRCSCPDPMSPCKHIAAVLLLVGEYLDEDPFLLLTMRGRTKEQIMAALRQRRADHAVRPMLQSRQTVRSHPVVGGNLPLEQCLDSFWEMGEEMQDIKIHVVPPQVETELLKVLGNPLFAEDEMLHERLAQVYRVVSQRALNAAFDH